MADELKVADADIRHARRAEKDAKAAKSAAEEARKKAEDRVKAAEDRAKAAEEQQWFAEDWAQKAKQATEEAETSKAELEEALRTAQQELASAQAEHEKYIRVALPVALEEARAKAVANFLEFEDFNARIVHMYHEGMRDMKARFTTANPGLVGVDWSFVSAESKEIVAEEVPEEGEVTGAARELDDLIVIDDQVSGPEQPDMPKPQATPAEPQQPAAPAGQEQPESSSTA
ncbi:hypothetical protein TIFTF001_034952 [Ficus carica]|uniref:Uncharacterized protein n=1 Tax=Ficus carica TaxID=3494 RepID=A0AA88E2C5_FICCA|nr:hypothetical protein TIFTF001_034952 [Ficus carica]